MIKYDMWVGCTAGGNDFFDAEDGVFYEATVSDLPVDGGPVYVFLISHNGTEEGLFIQRYTYTAPPDVGSTVVSVTGPEAWVDTGIDVDQAMSLEISACGHVIVNTTGSPTFKADGNAECPGVWRYGFPAPALPCWSLMGRMDQGEPFLVGPSFRAPAGSLSGRLYLGVNDDNVTDNGGSFRATIRLNAAP
jgi:hypothetical protein